ncbi:hypothetical protein TVAG_277030 [Trichomonas vaginalis G3]|uniref:receptor protein-tyrosine kinase n=1 Tax=Trichomonas vaginalis (strain ATCC PRA-98 / G3) TaxID=412133 RepID=A2FP63_TRIV3|nr:glycine-rich protein family [Trichomonas vaginalis G3]EAX93298.1 hypothetical protein TVAG_277030 [Trichomonas vaginalis G3]KAI5547491.1 glycine-rich protein family [Trichomonas vaginalis G3]|eukprot:XP_001306228.1 hypothetical protein [Trichomonas vaginalis G3]
MYSNYTPFYSYGGGGPGQASGGGSSDIRINPGDFDDFDGLKSRIIVAAGSGSGDGRYHAGDFDPGGSAGGLTGYGGHLGYSEGGSQISGGSGQGVYKGRFGIGGGNKERLYANGIDGNGAGGGGYFGGSASHIVDVSGGAGGSSFISGHKGCIAIAKNFTEENMTFSDASDPSIHFSGLAFYNTEMIDGYHYMPLPNGEYGYGNPGNGAIRITKLFLNQCHSCIIYSHIFSIKLYIFFLGFLIS